MSKATTADDLEPVDGNRGLDYLDRVADVLDVTEHVDTESSDRAQSAIGDDPASDDVDVDELPARDVYRVEMDDGEPHWSLFVTHSNRNDNAAACTCEGYRHHGYCAHLFVLAFRDIRDDLLRQDDERATTLVDSDGVDADVVDHSGDGPAGDDEHELEDDDLPNHVGLMSSVNDGYFLRCLKCGQTGAELEFLEHMDGCPAVEDFEDRENDDGRGVMELEDEPDDEDFEDRLDTPTTGPVGAAPDWAKSPIQERGGELDLNKDGCQFVRAALGISVTRTFLERAENTDWEYATVECRAEYRGDSVERTATAHIDESNVEKYDMNRMAETRAFKRAIKSISGAGLALFADR